MRTDEQARYHGDKRLILKLIFFLLTFYCANIEAFTSKVDFVIENIVDSVTNNEYNIQFFFSTDLSLCKYGSIY